MVEDVENEEKFTDIESKPKSLGKLFKAFMIAGGIAILGGGAYGIVKLVEEKNAEKQKNEWYAINPDAEKISADVENGKFYAMKKVDAKKVAQLKAEKAKYEAQKKAIIDEANKEFSKALQARDVEGMKAAVAKGANNINTPNAKGETPLMQLVKDAESAKAYQGALYLISINVDVNVKDKDGATAEDHAAVMNTLKGRTLQREIAAKKDAKVNRGGNSQELRELDDILAKANERILEEETKGYEVKVDKDGWEHSSAGVFTGGDRHFVESVGLDRKRTDIEAAKIAQTDKFFEKHLR